MSVEAILHLLRAHRFHFQSEQELHDGISEALSAAGLAFEREVKLIGMDRIDFMVGSVGLEVKVGQSFADVLRQLHRYVQAPQLEALILVTTRSRHRAIPEFLGGKPLYVEYLLGSVF